jgi:hypothetical protein
MSEQKLSEKAAIASLDRLSDWECLDTEGIGAYQIISEIIARETNCDTLAVVNSALRGALDYVKNHSTQQDVVFIAEEALSACPPDSMAQQLADSRKDILSEALKAVEACEQTCVVFSDGRTGVKHAAQAIKELLSKHQGKEGEK